MGKKRLTRKELVEHIRQTMPSDYNEYEKLAFIEFEVAKNVSFDEKYLWGDIETSQKIYKLAKREARIPHSEIKRKLICVTMAELFGYVAKEFGFEIRYQKRMHGYETKTGGDDIFATISDRVQEHVCPVVGLPNGCFIEVDIQADLERLQTYSKPNSFGQARHAGQVKKGRKIEILPQKIVDDTFRKIYGLKENEYFTDEYMMVLAAKLSYRCKTSIEMLDNFLDDPRIKKAVQNTRCIEANKILKFILRFCYEINIENQFFKDKNNAIIDECILSNHNGQKRYSFCIYAEDEEQEVLYIYSKKSRRMVKLNKEEIQELTGQVMNVELKGKSTELKKHMRAFVSGHVEKSDEHREECEVISLEDIFLDEDEEELE